MEAPEVFATYMKVSYVAPISTGNHPNMTQAIMQADTGNAKPVCQVAKQVDKNFAM